MRIRADRLLMSKGLVRSRSQAADLIKRGKVTIGAVKVTKPGILVLESEEASILNEARYVSRAGDKLASVAEQLRLQFRGKVMLDVGSSTGGFTDYALQNGATYVIAVDVGTEQLDASLRINEKVELHEKTDIRDVQKLSRKPGIVVIDVSFISVRDILPGLAKLVGPEADIVVMLKPQFETGAKFKHKGVIKNEHMRREIFKSFEQWAKERFVVIDKADSKLPGEKGNLERFYVLKSLK